MFLNKTYFSLYLLTQQSNTFNLRSSLPLREERRLRVFENRVLTRIFGPNRDEATGEWRKLHNEELNELYCSPDIVRVIKLRRMRWAGHVARMGKRREGFGGETGGKEAIWKTKA